MRQVKTVGKLSFSRRAATLAAFILVSQLAGAIGSLFTTTSMPSWYSLLEKPFFTPPSWAFGPVWVSLYTLMGIALFFVWEKRPEDRNPYKLFALQLILNALWPLFFFGLHSPLLGLACITALWIAILLTTRSFYKVSRNAAILMLPYIAWVTLAAALNLGVLVLNS